MPSTCRDSTQSPDAQFHGIIRNSGEAPNIVPEEVTAEFYIRALDKNYLLELIKKVDACAEERPLLREPHGISILRQRCMII